VLGTLVLHCDERWLVVLRQTSLDVRPIREHSIDQIRTGDSNGPIRMLGFP
jgi:hypothetical protein